MNKLERMFSTNFTYGLIKCVLTFEGPYAEKYPDMMDNIHAVVSKHVYRAFFPKVEQGVEMFKPSPGVTKLTEVVKAELLDHTFTLEVELDLSIDDVIPEIALRAMVVDSIGTGVFDDAIARFSRRVFVENVRDQLESRMLQDLDDAFGGTEDRGPGALFRALANRGESGIGVPFPFLRER